MTRSILELSSRLALISVLGLTVFFRSELPADTFTVGMDGQSDFTDIQSALDAAGDRDTVYVGPGEYVIETSLDFNRVPNPEGTGARNTRLISRKGPERTIIRLAPDVNTGSLVSFTHGETSRTQLVGFTLTGGRGTTISLDGGLRIVGGAIYCDGSSARIRRCILTGNRAREWGGALYASSVSDVSLRDCLITGNYAESGGAVYVRSASVSILGCTISGNQADEEGQGGLFLDRSSGLLSSSILWDNRSDGVFWTEGSELDVKYSLVEAGEVLPGDGNLNVDPLFVRPGHWERQDTGLYNDDVWVRGDYHLQPESPALDVSPSQAFDSDLEGNDRSCVSATDLGVYEFCHPVVAFLRGDANQSGIVDLSDAIFNLSIQFVAGGVDYRCVDA